MSKNKKLHYKILIIPILSVLFLSSLLTYIFISIEKENFLKDSYELEKIYINDLKKDIKNRIKRVEDLIQTYINLTNENEKKVIKNFVGIGYKIIEEIYLYNKKLSKEELIQKIKHRLKGINSYDKNHGYYFLLNSNNKIIMNIQVQKEKNETISNLKEIKQYFIEELKKTTFSKNKNETNWYEINSEKEGDLKKKGYIKFFEPLGLYIGVAKYQEDINQKIKKEIIKLISIVKYDKDDYIFALNNKGTTLLHINKNAIGKTILQNNKESQENIKNLLKIAKNEDGGFIKYTPIYYKAGSNSSKKISYVKKIKNYDLIIGTGKYTINIDKKIALQKEKLNKVLEKTIKKIIFVSILISFFLIIIVIYLATSLRRRFIKYEKELTNKNQKLKLLNQDLENEVKKQVFNVRKKDEILYHQSKLAAMGEMIENIAHQWRQPLSTISTAASGIKLQDEMEILKKSTMYHSLDTITKNTQMLSQTIEDFRNFFKSNKEKTNFNIENTIKKVFFLISTILKNKNIKIIKNIDNCIIYSLENELTQALLNILTNAKDALQESKQEEKFIFIDITHDKNKVYIKIKDNAGGIKDNVIDKIFEPYFTTKFKSQGTGIGLYMTRTIIINHMKGQINAKNVKFEYLNKKYEGAQFEIILKK